MSRSHAIAGGARSDRIDGCHAPSSSSSSRSSSASSDSASSSRCCRSTRRRSARRRRPSACCSRRSRWRSSSRAPVLGELSDRWGRRPILIFSLLGTVVSFALLAMAHSITMLFVARIVDGLSGGNITTARAYIADVDAGRGPREALWPHRRGVRSRVHLRPRARRAVRAHQLYGADLGGRHGLGDRGAARVSLAARAGATRLGGRGAALVARAWRPDVAACAPLDPDRSISATGSRSRSTRRRSRCSASVASGGTRRTSATSWRYSPHLV